MYYNTYLANNQDRLVDLAEVIWSRAQSAVPNMLTEAAPVAPTLIEMPRLMTPYFNHAGFYAHSQNLIVTSMEFARSHADINGLLVHELTHWLQFRLNNYRQIRDTHLSPSWSVACWVVGEAVTSGRFGKPLAFYKPFTSTRDGGKPVRISREGALNQQQLHDFPDCIPPDIWSV